MQPLEHGLFLLRQIRDDAMEEEGGLIKQPLGGLDVLEDDALGHRLELRLFLGRQLLASKDHHRHVRQRRFSVHFFEELEAGHVGQAEVEHNAVEGLVEHRLQGRVPGRDGHHLDIFIAKQLNDRLPFDVVVLDHQQSFRARDRKVLDAAERRFQSFRGGRLDEIGKSAVSKSMLPFLLQRHDLHGDMTRGRVELELV